ncbi:Annexin A13 [Phlyctochytrium planicorne]|nr:Annexin A13 [Phlyctochytrium planicorne]
MPKVGAIGMGSGGAPAPRPSSAYQSPPPAPTSAPAAPAPQLTQAPPPQPIAPQPAPAAVQPAPVLPTPAPTQPTPVPTQPIPVQSAPANTQPVVADPKPQAAPPAIAVPPRGHSYGKSTPTPITPTSTAASIPAPAPASVSAPAPAPAAAPAPAHTESDSHVAAPLLKLPGPPEVPRTPVTDREIEDMCMKLSIATRGVLTDSSIIIMTQICAGHPPSEMARISAMFKKMFNNSLADAISNCDTSLIISSCTMASGSVLEGDAIGILESLKGLAVDYDAIYEVLIGRSNDELLIIKNCYELFFNKELDVALSERLKGTVYRVLKPLIQGDRRENAGPEDPRKLALELKSLCKNSSVESFAAILGQQSFANLAKAFDAWTSSYGSPIEKAVQKEFSSDIEKPLLAMISSIRDPVAHLSSQFQSALAGIVSNQAKLLRLAVRFRGTQILEDAIADFDKKAGKKSADLKSRITKATSGHVQRFLKVALGFERDW